MARKFICARAHRQMTAGAMHLQRLTRSDDALPLSILNHVQPDAVFDALAWLLAFQLERNAGSAVLADLVQEHHGGVADKLCDIVGNFATRPGADGQFSCHRSLCLLLRRCNCCHALLSGPAYWLGLSVLKGCT